MSGKCRPYPAYRDSGNTLLGSVPNDWVVKRLKYVSPNVTVGIVVNPSNYFEDEGTVPFLRGVDITRDRIATENVKKMSDASNSMNSKSTLREGDLVSMRVGYPGVTAVIPKELDGANCASLLIIRKPNVISSRLLCYQINSDIGQNQIKLLQQGAAQEQINVSDIVNFWVVCPSQSEAEKIEEYLDHETAKIDTLIEQQQQLIQLLKEKRQAVISHAVTKGLNPDAPMKDSGVEWLGEVPAHWETSQLKYKVKSGTSITYGIVQAGPHVEDGIPYIKTSDMSGDKLPIDGYSKTSHEIDNSYSRSKVYEGDIVIAIRASVGKCLIVPKEITGANLTQGTAKISPSGEICSDYLLAYLSSEPVQLHLNTIAKGATFKEITLDMLRRVPVLVPSIEEQKEIMLKVQALMERFTSLISNAELQMNLLSERRIALISAAVTGKIDVRNWQAPQQ